MTKVSQIEEIASALSGGDPRVAVAKVAAAAARRLIERGVHARDARRFVSQGAQLKKIAEAEQHPDQQFAACTEDGPQRELYRFDGSTTLEELAGRLANLNHSGPIKVYRLRLVASGRDAAWATGPS